MPGDGGPEALLRVEASQVTISDMRDVLRRAIELAMHRGADFSEARMWLVKELKIVFDGRPRVSSAVEAGGDVRVLSRGLLGFAHFTGLPKSLEAQVKRALAISMSGVAARPVEIAGEPEHLEDWGIRPAVPHGELSLGEKVSMVRKLYRRAGMHVTYIERSWEKLYVNSEGSEVYGSGPQTIFAADIQLAGGPVYRAVVGGSMGIEAFERLGVEEGLGRAVESYKQSLGGRGGWRGGVVLGGRVVGLLAHLLAHMREGWRLRPYVGVDGGLTIVDDPTFRGGLSFYIYDDEGVRSRPRMLYIKGRGGEMLLSRVSSAARRLMNNGSAIAVQGNPPVERPSTTYVAPVGGGSSEEVLEYVGDGLYVDDYLGYAQQGGHVYIRGVGARLVVKGELGPPVRFPLVTVNLADFLGSMVFSREVEFRHDVCRAHGGELYVWFGGPMVALPKTPSASD